MNCSKLEVSPLVAELRAHAEHLQFVAAFAARKQLTKFFAREIDELGDVVAFLEYLSAAPQSAPQTGKESQTRCLHYRAIRRAFAITKDCGLDVKDESAMRWAIGRALGRTIESRDELNGGDWQTVGDLMKRGALAW